MATPTYAQADRPARAHDEQRDAWPVRLFWDVADRLAGVWQSAKGVRVHPVVALLLIVYAWELVATAWVSDDAFVTADYATNFWAGDGLTFNPGERVQAFTSPLLLLCLIVAQMFTGEPYFSALAVNFAASAAAVLVLVFGLARGKPERVAPPLMVLVLSKTFIDYSTSGLENSLLFLLLAVVAYQFVRRQYFGYKQLRLLGGLAGLILLARPDGILLVLPLLVAAFWRRRADGVDWSRALRAGLVGLIPVGVWELFSVFYYGYFVPNAYFAKLDAGVPRSDLVRQGSAYWLATLSSDPIGVVGGAAVTVVTLFAAVQRGRRRPALIVAGALLYGLYVVVSGGDFMVGRFYAAPIFLAAIALTQIAIRQNQVLAVALTLVVVGLARPDSPLSPDKSYASTQALGVASTITDERALYFEQVGLLSQSRTATWREYHTYRSALAANGQPVFVTSSIGMARQALGAGTHLLDSAALADPLLSHLPARWDDDWVPGRLVRELPDGYEASLAAGDNQLTDPDLAEYYEAVRLVTRGDLWSFDRWAKIVQVNLGAYDDLINSDRYRYPRLNQGPRVVTQSDVATVRPAGSDWDDGTQMVGDEGLTVWLDELQHARHVTISFDNNDDYDVAFLKEGEVVAYQTWRAVGGDGLTWADFDLTWSQGRKGYDQVTILPHDGDGAYSVGHIALG